MVEVPFWSGEVHNFAYSYDDEDDTIIILPLDEENEVICEELSLAVSAPMLGDFLEKLQKDYKNIMDVRRAILRGKAKGVPPEVVHGRFRGQVIAEDLDSFLRGLSSDKAVVQDPL